MKTGFQGQALASKATGQTWIRLHILLHEPHPRQSQNMSRTVWILPPDVLLLAQACCLKAHCLISALLRYLAYIGLLTLLHSHLHLIFTLLLKTLGK